MACSMLLGLPLPLSVTQILYINLATDGLPALALSVDPPEKDLLRPPPRNPHTGIFTRPVVILMAVGGCWLAAVSLTFFVLALQNGITLQEAMAMTFVLIVLIEFFKAYNFRSDRQSVFRRPFANRWLNLAVAWELLLLAAIVYVPFFHPLFGSFALTLKDLGLIVLLASKVVPVLETAKWMARRGWFGVMP